MTKVLVVDDERPILEMLELSLSSEGYEVLTAENGEKALEIFKQHGPRLVLTDIKMPGIDGIEVLKRIKAMDNEVEVIVITGHGDMDTAVAALQNGASDFVTKPLRDEVLMVSLERAKKKLNMSEQLRDYTDNLEEKVQESQMALKQAQDELVRNERMASIGETVGGLAHCIKNILTGLGGGMYMVHAGMAKEKPDMLEEGWAMFQRNIERVSDLVLDLLSMFQRNIERVSDLVLDLLRYSKQAIPERTACKPNDIVSDVIRVLKVQASRDNIKLTKILDPNVTEACFEHDGIRRMLLNLVSNAIDACIYDVDGKSILFEFTDNGCGMTDEVKAQLFQRFFSTKAGRGTGLGLLVTQKIVQEHGGDIFIESKAEEGTTVFVRLPVD
jgi:signal transduction histidine kinase